VGEGEPPQLKRQKRRSTDVRPGTITELEDWEQGGAVWQLVELSSQRAVVDLCTCSGEPMDRVQSEDPEFIEFVRGRASGAH
jgi:hypothetical protein